jgi:hypothetical protein
VKSSIAGYGPSTSSRRHHRHLNRSNILKSLNQAIRCPLRMRNFRNTRPAWDRFVHPASKPTNRVVRKIVNLVFQMEYFALLTRVFVWTYSFIKATNPPDHWQRAPCGASGNPQHSLWLVRRFSDDQPRMYQAGIRPLLPLVDISIITWVNAFRNVSKCKGNSHLE